MQIQLGQELLAAISEKTFRKRVSLEKARFILSSTDLSESLLLQAAQVSHHHEYHNFDHELGAAEFAITIARSEGVSREMINLLAMVMLFHDALHSGISKHGAEYQSFLVLKNIIEKSSDLSSLYLEKISLIENLILATTFSQRGKYKTLHERIVQDADLAHLGQGPEYWLWASMGLVDEFSRQESRVITPLEFINNLQGKFIRYLETIGEGHVYLTEGARTIFKNPADSLTTVLGYNAQQIQWAYDVRKEDITLVEFTKELQRLAD